MLDRNDQKQSAERLIKSLPCHVQLPPKLRERFETTGVAPATPDDRRQFARMRCRSANNLAALQSQPTFPALSRGGQWARIYLADVSRGGLQIIHAEPLYPGERLHILLLSGAQVEAEVVRCRRLGEACFSVGLQDVSRRDATNVTGA